MYIPQTHRPLRSCLSSTQSSDSPFTASQQFQSSRLPQTGAQSYTPKQSLADGRTPSDGDRQTKMARSASPRREPDQNSHFFESRALPTIDQVGARQDLANPHKHLLPRAPAPGMGHEAPAEIGSEGSDVSALSGLSTSEQHRQIADYEDLQGTDMYSRSGGQPRYSQSGSLLAAAAAAATTTKAENTEVDDAEAESSTDSISSASLSSWSSTSSAQSAGSSKKAAQLMESALVTPNFSYQLQPAHPNRNTPDVDKPSQGGKESSSASTSSHEDKTSSRHQKPHKGVTFEAKLPRWERQIKPCSSNSAFSFTSRKRHREQGTQTEHGLLAAGFGSPNSRQLQSGAFGTRTPSRRVAQGGGLVIGSTTPIHIDDEPVLTQVTPNQGRFTPTGSATSAAAAGTTSTPSPTASLESTESIDLLAFVQRRQSNGNFVTACTPMPSSDSPNCKRVLQAPPSSVAAQSRIPFQSPQAHLTADELSTMETPDSGYFGGNQQSSSCAVGQIERGKNPPSAMCSMGLGGVRVQRYSDHSTSVGETQEAGQHAFQAKAFARPVPPQQSGRTGAAPLQLHLNNNMTSKRHHLENESVNPFETQGALETGAISPQQVDVVCSSTARSTDGHGQETQLPWDRWEQSELQVN